MSPRVLIVVFALIGAAIAAVAVWMAWYARRAIAQHREQVQLMLEEMRREIDKKG